MSPEQDFISAQLLKKDMIICCGSGGVGKTTLSAVLALRAASLGRKVLVMTIDPAKRLANALGMEALGNTITQVDPETIRQAGFKQFSGELHATMLDCKRTFDALVEKYAPSPEVVTAIMKNSYYQHISNAMTGSHEYMAMEKLYEIYNEKRFDLIVLDTPPTHNALDFLDAPNRLTSFLDDSVLKWFIKPYFVAGKFSFKTVKRGSKFIFKILERITGLEVLQDLSEFFLAFSGMYTGFKERAQKVKDLLTDERAAFFLVTSPNRLTIEECIFFYQKLQEYRTPFGGILVNKFHRDFGVDADKSPDSLVMAAKAEEVDKSSPENLLKRLAQNLYHFQILHEIDGESLAHLKKETSLTDENIRRIPHFETDILELEDLRKVMETLFEAEESNLKSSAQESGRAKGARY